jgi:hypothetical protein
VENPNRIAGRQMLSCQPLSLPASDQSGPQPFRFPARLCFGRVFSSLCLRSVAGEIKGRDRNKRTHLHSRSATTQIALLNLSDYFSRDYEASSRIRTPTLRRKT